jgi:hypothetical protein
MMSTVAGSGILPSFYRSPSLTSATSTANQALARSPDAADATAAGGGATTQSGATIPTGFSTAPKLSADVIGALIESQAQQAAGSTSGSGTTGQATNLSGASATSGPTTAPSNSSSAPPTLQEIAGQFDLHDITYQQEQQLQSELVSSGALTQQDGLHLEGSNDAKALFDIEHFKIINGQVVATTPSAPGTLINLAQDSRPNDLVQRFKQQRTEDQSFGISTLTASDQKIVNVLNRLDSIRNGGTA